jgi:hypothetical protein
MQGYSVLTRSLLIVTIALTPLLRINAARAQAIPKSLEQGGSDAAINKRKNAWTVGIAGGLVDGTYMRFADELGKVLDDGDNLRVLPMVSYSRRSRGLPLAHVPRLLRAPLQNIFKFNSRAVGAGDVVNYAKVLPQPARAFERGIAALADRHGCFAVFIGEMHDPHAAFHF